MADNKNKNSNATLCFRAALKHFLEKSGQKQIEVISNLGVPVQSVKNFLSGASFSLARMEVVAEKLDTDLPSMLIEGRAILEGKEPPEPPATVINIVPERELELLKKLEAAHDKIEHLKEQLKFGL